MEGMELRLVLDKNEHLKRFIKTGSLDDAIREFSLALPSPIEPL